MRISVISRAGKVAWSGSSSALLAACFLCAVLLWPSKCTQEPSEWTREYVESRWELRESIGIYRMSYGWHPSQEFYATQYEGAIVVVDRLNKRWCKLGRGNWATAGWSDPTEGVYSIYSWNQYGWSTYTSLNLSSWEVTITVHGSCFQWMSCTPLDPPRVEFLGYCQPNQTYGPGGIH